MENTIQQLIEMLKSIAPDIWEVLIRQTIIYGFADITVGLFFGVAAFLCKNKLFKKDDVDDDDYEVYDDEARLLLYAVMGLFSFLSFLFLLFGTMYLLNPSYWAIHNLLGKIN